MGEPSFIILGAGVAGLCFAMQLTRAGRRDFVILEKADRFGGTWRDNSYPGSGCDIPSHLYCYSFEPNPEWSRKYAEQPEILAYLEACAAKYRLAERTRFGVEALSARYDDTRCSWTVTLSNGEELTADFLICATGQLNRPQLPPIEGLERFAGRCFHSARWDHDCELGGKRVAVIGNGASAVQLVPRIAREAAALTIFQRSPNWVVEKSDRRYLPLERWLFRRAPWLMRAHRYGLYWRLEGRFAAFQQDTLVNRVARFMAARHLASVADPALRARLTPDYPIGCKRILISNDYYPALARSNVEVVTDVIERVVEDGVVAGGRHHPVDAIVFATGFESLKFLAPVELVGRGGERLHDRWRDGAEAYLGMAVAGFPNLFILYGPNTNLGHNSVIFMIECQTRFVLSLIEAAGARSLEVRPEVQRRYNEALQASLDETVWSAGCTNWYKTAAGKNTNNWASYTASYWWRTRRPDVSAFICDARDDSVGA